MARFFGRSRSSAVPRGPREVWADWQAAPDAETAEVFAAELVAIRPQSFTAWFEAGLLSKAQGRWHDCLERNARAVELFTAADAVPYDGANPAAWNLGTAATALADWPTARNAWAAYGIDGMRDSAGPIDANFGMAPIRLNPDRPSLTHQVMHRSGETEVVWCWRRSPAHAVISSVPLPESGHRFRDVVLHDGEPKGTRWLDGQERSVFDELDRLRDSGIPTWQAIMTGMRDGDGRRLADALGPLGLGVDEWSGIRIYCSECSHGRDGVEHDHAPIADDRVRVGLAGVEAELQPALDAWLANHPHVVIEELTLLW
ncbi:MAG TPA: hypothetical protein VJ872_20450 [Nocardioides sp.]|nr:hypothetical protein [Nocardioides sp.]